MRGARYLTSGVLGSLLVLASAASCSAERPETPTNELPMYGGIPRTAREAKADQEFIEQVIKDTGNRETAFRQALSFGWDFYFKKNYTMAMKRFNQAWLLKPNDPEVFVSFGNAMGQMGDWGEFVTWNRKAAEEGHPKGQVNLAWAYLLGIGGLEADPVQAAHWCRLSAEQGLLRAQNMLGLLYEWGHGLEEDPVEAAKWYKLADQQGYAEDWKVLRKAAVAEAGDSAGVSFQDILNVMRAELERGRKNGDGY